MKNYQADFRGVSLKILTGLHPRDRSQGKKDENVTAKRETSKKSTSKFPMGRDRIAQVDVSLRTRRIY